MSHKSGFVVERAEEIVIRLDKGRGKTTQTSADGEEIGGRTTARCRVQPQFKPRTRRLEMKQKQFHSINIAVCVCLILLRLEDQCEGEHRRRVDESQDSAEPLTQEGSSCEQEDDCMLRCQEHSADKVKEYKVVSASRHSQKNTIIILTDSQRSRSML